MPKSEALKLAKLQARENEKTRLWALVSDPRVLSTLSLVGGVYTIEHIRFAENEGRNQRLKTALLAAVIYQSLSMAGAKGWPAAVASLVGGVVGSSGGGTPWSPLQAGEATALGAGLGTFAGGPGVGTIIGGATGLGIDTIYQWVT
jgi:hypothetical protein